ncbi:MAG: hypothetical protein ACK5M8_03485, partial [Shewanella algae]
PCIYGYLTNECSWICSGHPVRHKAALILTVLFAQDCGLDQTFCPILVGKALICDQNVHFG